MTKMQKPRGARPRKPSKPSKPQPEYPVIQQMDVCIEEIVTIISFERFKEAAKEFNCSVEDVVLCFEASEDPYEYHCNHEMWFKGPDKMLPDPNYNVKIKKYHKKIKTYEEKMEDYEKKMEEWHAWDAYQDKIKVQEEEERERKLYEKLKRKFH